MDFKPQKSVEWYDPKQLANTGIKAVISGIFGNFNDKREIQAALYQQEDSKALDYSQESDEIWIDYISDTGDGFDATFTMASLLAKEEIEVEGQKIPRGKLLIMGGDQVYPVATREEYRNRLQGPYATALPSNDTDKQGISAPHLFAIPGNHDWYDGLTTFIKVFCQQRWIGNWRTRQKRSYFALKLPHNVWLFGIDVQLNSDVDYNQIQYFETVLKEEVKEGGKVILCTAEPTWVYSTSVKKDSNNNLEFFEKKLCAINENTTKPYAKQILTLAGDWHHYARYENENGGMKITAGGGGAFLHPTQNLPEHIGDIFGGDLNLKSRFPSSSDSKKLLFNNFKFPFANFKMSLVLGAIYALVGWLLFLSFGTGVNSNLSFIPLLKEILFNPGIILLLILVIFGLGAFAETTPCNPKYKSSLPYALAGYIHGFGQAKMMLFFFFLFIKINPYLEPLYQLKAMGIAVVGCFAVGFLLGGFLFGLYLIFSNLVLGNHDNEAYSALKWEGYKNFLRLHVTKDEVTIYPIGVKNVSRWQPSGKNVKSPFTANKPIDYQLIEKPITIRF